MMILDRALQKQIIDFLVSLPNINDTEKQQAFIFQAVLDKELQNQLPFGKPVSLFVSHVVTVAFNYGKMKDGRYALDSILETTKGFVGQDKQEYCNTLIEQLRYIREHAENEHLVPPEESFNYLQTVIIECSDNLIHGQEADASAKRLGDVAIDENNKEAVNALWKVILETNNLPMIIDPCAFTIGKILWEPIEVIKEIEDKCFDIFKESLNKSTLIVQKFAYTVGEVVLKTRNDRIRQRAKEFINTQLSHSHFIVRDAYTYTKHRILS